MYVFISPLSRKAKSTRAAYDYLRLHTQTVAALSNDLQNIPFECLEGYSVPVGERYRILNLRIQDEHYSPYVKSDMSLFHLLMMDDNVDMVMFRAENGWLITFEGIQALPQPFGNQGHDLR